MATNAASAPSSTEQASTTSSSVNPATTTTSASAGPPPTSDDPLPALLATNARWATAMQASHPALMASLAKSQSPHTLWIGCADSRVSPELLTGALPGALFVHRNVANVVHTADGSLGAALAYAVGPLGVRSVVLCGHTGCGGVAAALGRASAGGVVDAWLAPVRELRAKLETEQGGLTGLSAEARAVKLVEENVKAGVRRLRSVACVVAAEKERGLQVRGLVYDVGTGLLRELDVSEAEEARTARGQLFRLE